MANENTVTISIEEYFDLRQKAEMNAVLLGQIHSIDMRFIRIDEKLLCLEDEVRRVMGMADKKMPTCGDCIHADICKQVNCGWFSPNNPAYCKGFKDKTKLVEVVRCKDCKHWIPGDSMMGNSFDDMQRVGSCPSVRFRRLENEFCSYGERKDDEALQ